MWGIGRHLLGSQVYDYWADPWGRVHEHWADTDRLNVPQRRQPGIGRGGTALTMGHTTAGEVPRSCQSLSSSVHNTVSAPQEEPHGSRP